jgi:hypothetical protein
MGKPREVILSGPIVAQSEIVEVRTDGVRCLLCGRSMECAGTHFFRRHQIGGTEMSPSDRLKAYGLPAGTRLASDRLRKHLADTTRAAGGVLLFGENQTRTGSAEMSRLSSEARKGLRQSNGQVVGRLRGAKKAGRLRSENSSRPGRVVVSCQTCGIAVSTILSRMARFCSRSCSQGAPKVGADKGALVWKRYQRWPRKARA